MQVYVDEELCTGCGLCTNIAADLFEMQDDKAVVIVSALDESQADLAKEAADSCPVEAIKVENAE